MPARKRGGGKAPLKESRKPAPPNGTESIPVVAIGASAGGLDALKTFFAGMAGDSGMAFVVIQHQAPGHESLMDDILARCTAMPVSQITGRTAVEANHVYVAPPNHYLAIKKGFIELTQPAEGRLHLPIDMFLRSLAEDRGEKAICIILSGTGSDGTLGLKSVKEFGGMAMVQDPDTAAFDGMPRSAIATQLVDYVLPVAEMPEALRRYGGHRYVQGAAPEPQDSDDIVAILALLRTRLKRDFRFYKKLTLFRRIERRMGVAHAATTGEYLQLLRSDPTEPPRLAKDLMIGVTQFFRDREAFEALAAEAIPSIVKKHDPDRPIRVWVPGCATGEEAYSIAMLILEALPREKAGLGLQVFASDIDEGALEIARAGKFPESIAIDVSPERLRRFFVREEGSYRANRQLRECITFSEQDLIADPPFSRLDLISCRNLLIYIEPDMQTKLVALFNYALVDGGYLFLGSSETVGRQRNLFEPVNGKARIFKRLKSGKPSMDFPLAPGLGRRFQPEAAAGPRAGAKRETRLPELAHRLLAKAFAPAAVLINRQAETRFHFGPVDKYLMLPTGESGQDLLAMAREGLRPKLRQAIQSAVKTGKVATAGDIRLKRNGRAVPVKLSVMPVDAATGVDGLLLVTFADDAALAPVPKRKGESKPRRQEASLVEQLENELQAARRELQDTIEDLETANEELKASNEEAMSANEELQSGNEELETAKEEMQSLNEELTTVNAQLRDKVEDLEAAQNDIQNLLNSGEIATIFLDREFRIRRFTPAVTDLLSLIPADVGRPFSDFSQSFSDPGLLADAKKVLDRLIPAEAEVQAVGGAWYLRRILPYRAQDNRIDGVVITFADVTPLKTAERHAARLAAAVRDSNDAIIVQGLDGRIVEWNRGAESIYGYDQATALGMNVEVLVPAIDRRRHAELIERLFAGELAQAAETTRLTKDGRVIEVWLTATVLRDESGKPISMATTERDITARNRQAAKLEQALEALQTQAKLLAVAKESAERANQAKSQFLSHMSHELRTPLNAIIGFSDAIREQTLGPLGHAKYADYVNSIHTAGTRLLNLIGDLLDLAKIEAGAFELNEEDIDLGAMIDDCFGLLGRTAEMAQVALRRDLPAGLPPFWADERQLRGGLLNLISNSIKFTGKGGQVTVAARLENKKTLVVTVSDSGVGMSPAEANKAMAPFGQIDNVMGRKNRGSGLGLPLVKAMMDLHGGTMEIDSKPGVGTTVTLRFPPERTVFV